MLPEITVVPTTEKAQEVFQELSLQELCRRVQNVLSAELNVDVSDLYVRIERTEIVSADTGNFPSGSKTSTPLSELDLQPKVFHALMRSGVTSVEEVSELIRSGNIMELRGIGKGSAKQLLARLVDHGYLPKDFSIRRL